MRKLYLSILRNKDHLALFLALTISSILLLSDPAPEIRPIRAKANDLFSFLYSPVAWIRSIALVEEENAYLRERNLQLSLQIETMYDLTRENEQLQNMLEFKRESRLTLVPAKVINKGIFPNMLSFSIDVGLEDGVDRNAPVLTPLGVVGKTTLVSDHTSIVQLLSDLNYRLSVRILPGGGTGILRWKEGDMCEIREVAKNVDVHIGDRVVTSGFSDIYPENLPVGEVAGVLDERASFQKIVKVRIFNQIGSLINVFVITGP